MNRAAITGVTVLVALAALTACQPNADDTPSPKPPAASSAAPTPSETALAPDPEPAAVGCETIVSAATFSGFASAGITITPEADFAAKLSSEGNPLAAFFTAGGVLCQLAGAGSQEASEIYGYAPLTAAQIAPIAASFIADGYVETDGDVGVQFQVPADAEGMPRLCYLRPDAFSICGNDDARLQEIMTTLGLG